MPTVPIGTQGEIPSRPFPGVRLPGAPGAEAFGAPGPEFAAQARGLVEDVQKRLIKQQEEADNLALQDADAQLGAQENRLLFDPQSGAFTKRGKNAFGVIDQVDHDYRNVTSRISRGLANDRQRQAFQRRVESRRNSINRALQRHVFSETVKYDRSVLETLIDTEQEAASKGDFDRVMAGIRRQREAIEQHAERNGLPKQWVTLRTQEAVSATHLKVIGGLLAEGNDEAAQVYFEFNENQILSEDAERVKPDLQEGNIRGESQRRTDEIMAKAETESRALAAARKITDPEMRDMVVNRVKSRFQEVRAADARRNEQAFEGSVDIVDNAFNKGIVEPGDTARDLIHPSIWNELDDRQKSSLNKRMEADPGLNEKALLDFTVIASDPKELGKMSRARFETFWARLDKTWRAWALKEWRTAVENVNDPDVGAAFDSAFTENEQIIQAMGNARIEGIKRTDTLEDINRVSGKRKAFVRFKREFNERLKKEFQENQRNPKGLDKEAIMNRMALEETLVKVDQPGFDPEIAVLDLTPEQVNKAYIAYERLDPIVVDRFIEQAQRLGVTLDPDGDLSDEHRLIITRAFIAATHDLDDLVIEILRGDK